MHDAAYSAPGPIRTDRKDNAMGTLHTPGRPAVTPGSPARRRARADLERQLLDVAVLTGPFLSASRPGGAPSRCALPTAAPRPVGSCRRLRTAVVSPAPKAGGSSAGRSF